MTMALPRCDVSEHAHALMPELLAPAEEEMSALRGGACPSDALAGCLAITAFEGDLLAAAAFDCAVLGCLPLAAWPLELEWLGASMTQPRPGS